MKPEKMLRGKTILIVDDERDVLDTLIDLLDMSKLDTAGSFEEAKKLLEDKENKYDLVILDIMGVDGYALLEIANNRKIPAIMLTAHALNEENLVKSIKSGSASFISHFNNFIPCQDIQILLFLYVSKLKRYYSPGRIY